MKNHNLFDQLKLYSTFINVNKLNGFSLFDNRLIESKISSLYAGVLNNKEIDEIAQELGYKNEESSSFIKLQSRLLDKLKASLFFLDESNAIFSNLGQEFYKLSKALFQHRVLLMLNRKSLSFDTIEKDLKSSLKYEIPEISLQLLKPLMTYYGYAKPNKKKFNNCVRLIGENLRAYSAELRILEHYSIISYEYIYKKKEVENLLKLIEEFEFEINSLPPFFYTQTAKGSYFELLSLKHQLLSDHQAVIDLSIETLAFFESRKYDSYLSKYVIYFDLVNSLIFLKNYNEAEITIKKISEVYSAGQYNWFRVKSLEFFLSMQQEDYDKAYIVVRLCISQKNLKLYSNITQVWLIKEAYIQFLINIKKITPSLTEEFPLKQFRLQKFINNVPDFSKEKRGLNVSILIIQMLFYLVDKKINAFIDRMDALNQYTYRYLRNDDSFRSNCFIKMILKIPDSNYHPVALQRHCAQLYKKLSATRPPMTYQSTNIEIIPYENLWEMILEVLEEVRK